MPLRTSSREISRTGSGLQGRNAVQRRRVALSNTAAVAAFLGVVSEYLADEYSLADIATFPWLSGAARMGVAIEPYPNLARWEQAIKARPAVTRAFAAKIKP
ncbi:glutathione binding-like protein [Sorangium sp. So ce295]|uniref:glutathione binding-like protein n=1 Tax=Sorangium sp. So ce295 TaxID=3133295 RepID=UPI003F5E878E